MAGQEFLDAFPVHQFVYTEKGWREKLVDVSTATSTPSKKPQVSGSNERIAAAKKEVLEKMSTSSGSSSSDTAAASNSSSEGKAEDGQKEVYHFRFVLSPSATPAVRSILLNTQTNNTRNTTTAATSTNTSTSVDSIDKETNTTPTTTTTNSSTTTTTQSASSSISDIARPSAKIGDGVEISPLAIATCEDVAQRVVSCGGAALLVDYGEDFTQEDSLRAFYKHKQVSVLSQVMEKLLVIMLCMYV